MLKETQFNAQDTADSDCPVCKGKGYIHCPDCGEHTKCTKCGGSGKRFIYWGSVYTIHWNVPETEVTCHAH